MGQKTFNTIVIGLLVVIAVVLAATAYFTSLRGAVSTGEGEEAVIVTRPRVAEEAPQGAASRGATPEGEPTDTAGAPPETGPVGTVESEPEGQATPPTTAAPDEAGSVSPRDPALLSIGLEGVASGLRAPVGIGVAGDGSGRLFVLEKAGIIRIVQGGSVLGRPFLDLTDRVGSGGSEQGLLGIAFHPDYARNGQFFINYTDRQGNTVVSRFLVSDDPNRADAASESRVLAVEQPASNHNGGHLVFGPDGYLYIGLGDGGGAGDVYGNAQNGQTLLGSMLRLNVDELPYRIPPDNPFVGDPAVLDEIWAYGLRNPWRYSFDRATGDLYIGDVGQNAYEEVNFQPATSGGGENYGWPIMEGFHCYREPESCDPSGLALPVAEYSHTGANCSVTGGYVYRGQAFPTLEGVYFFGDFCSGRIWGLAPTSEGEWQASELLQVDISIASFGQDEAGELYVADMRGGTIFRLVAQ